MVDFVKHDNLTFQQKVMLRQTAVAHLRELGVEPVVLEAYGGWGALYDACYYDIPDGCVLESDPAKSVALAIQRPAWAVYEADTPVALSLGAGDHLRYTLADFDPYGDPYPAIQAFFSSRRPFAETMMLVVMDGLKWKTRSASGWQTETLAPLLQEGLFSNHDLWGNYEQVAEALCLRSVEPAGYRVTAFHAYSAGVGQKLCHWIARLSR